MADERRTNRGPRAAAANRAALLDAAVGVFGEQGYDAPLSAVARRAGVGQGVLYRHFPDRVALALAVFESGVAELEATGAPLPELLARITDQAIASVAFVRVVTPAGDDERLQPVRRRVRALLAAALDDARRAGAAPGTLGPDDLLLAVGMVASVLAVVPATERRATAQAAWALLTPALRG